MWIGDDAKLQVSTLSASFHHPSFVKTFLQGVQIKFCLVFLPRADSASAGPAVPILCSKSSSLALERARLALHVPSSSSAGKRKDCNCNQSSSTCVSVKTVYDLRCSMMLHWMLYSDCCPALPAACRQSCSEDAALDEESAGQGVLC